MNKQSVQTQQEPSTDKLWEQATPLAVEGSAVLHQFFRLDQTLWCALPESKKAEAAAEVSQRFSAAESAGKTAFYTVMGGKADLLLLHLRKDFEELQQAKLDWQQTYLSKLCTSVDSYISTVELSLHETSVKLYSELAQAGIAPHSAVWNRTIEETLARQREAMRPRLHPELPRTRYLCYYPMSRRRSESINWYTLPLTERQREMARHGETGRRWAGKVKQIVSASTGLDNWEWAVDLFSNDAIEFKKLVYEMRFDRISSVYSEFGEFYIGVRVALESLPELLNGHLLEFNAEDLSQRDGRSR